MNNRITSIIKLHQRIPEQIIYAKGEFLYLKLHIQDLLFVNVQKIITVLYTVIL